MNTKLATSARKTELKAEHDKMVKLQVHDSNYFRGKIHFEDDENNLNENKITQNYIVFQPALC